MTMTEMTKRQLLETTRPTAIEPVTAPARPGTPSFMASVLAVGQRPEGHSQDHSNNLIPAPIVFPPPRRPVPPASDK